MSALAVRDRDSLAPALIAAALLHVGLLALAVLLPDHPKPPAIGASVPITLVTSQQATDAREAIQAPQPQPAAAPEPQPTAPPQPPAPVLAPPSFGAPPPSPAPRRKETPPPQPSLKPAPAPKPLDFNRLQSIIDKARRAAGAPASSAPAGPARPETAAQARPNAGKGLTASDLQGLEQLLERLWNPNCDVPGGSAVKLQVRFNVGLNGDLIGAPDAGGALNSGDKVMAAAARRAIDAVREAEPFAEPYYGQSIVVNFDAKEACAKR